MTQGPGPGADHQRRSPDAEDMPLRDHNLTGHLQKGGYMGTEGKITLSVIKADVGGWVGHSTCHPDMLALAREIVQKAVSRRMLLDGQVLNVGDDVELIMTHERGEEDAEIHKFAWDTFMELTALAKKMKLYGAGQDMLGD